MQVPNETYAERAVSVWNVLSGVAKMTWHVMSGVTKTTRDVLSGVTKTAWDVLSGVANLCGQFCPECQKMVWYVLSRDVLSGSCSDQTVRIPRLCWSHIPNCWKSHAMANLIFTDTTRC